MATHSSIAACRIPWMRSLVGYSPKGHKESDTTEVIKHKVIRYRPKKKYSWQLQLLILSQLSFLFFLV